MIISKFLNFRFLKLLNISLKMHLICHLILVLQENTLRHLKEYNMLQKILRGWFPKDCTTSFKDLLFHVLKNTHLQDTLIYIQLKSLLLYISFITCCPVTLGSWHQSCLSFPVSLCTYLTLSGSFWVKWIVEQQSFYFLLFAAASWILVLHRELRLSPNPAFLCPSLWFKTACAFVMEENQNSIPSFSSVMLTHSQDLFKFSLDLSVWAALLCRIDPRGWYLMPGYQDWKRNPALWSF